MSDVLEATTPLPDRTIRYADHDDAVVDLHLPPGGEGPLLFLIHGGFWKAAYDRLHTRPMAAALAARGWTVATPEYRRVGAGGGWPTTYDDIRTAFDATLTSTLGDRAASEARVPGGRAVSEARVPGGRAASAEPPTPGGRAASAKPRRTTRPTAVVTGHSAGGHLALLLAADDPRVTGVVPLAPVCDLQAAVDLNLGDGAAARFLDGAAARFLDGAPTEDADPIKRTYRAPVALVHGTADDTVPITLARAFALWHPETRLVELDCGHYEPIDPDDPAFAAYAATLDSMSAT
ncbi:MAG TPA: alpha/beta hydrolase [Marmoricola sp.]|nr:alpha/beta hydrolase [Marmoricola sp.]